MVGTVCVTGEAVVLTRPCCLGIEEEWEVIIPSFFPTLFLTYVFGACLR